MKTNDTLFFGKSILVDMLAEPPFDNMGALTKRYLLNQKFCTDKQQLETEFNAIEQIILLLKDEKYQSIFEKIIDNLQHIVDIGGSVNNLKKGIILNDIELFEIKKFALIINEISLLIATFPFFNLPILSEIIQILDPEKTRVFSFYIYDAYSEELAAIRRKMKNANEDISVKYYQQSIEIEDKIRKQLFAKLQPFAQELENTLQQVAQFHLRILKAKQAIDGNWCKPKISDNQTSYKSLFNPQIKKELQKKGVDFHPIDIEFGKYPTLITGINMGGKTVVLRTLEMAQTLFQFGFYVPAKLAQIAIVDKVMVCREDLQNHLNGLSSFAAEMKQINQILENIDGEKSLLVLIDELARTTNPTEGAAIVNAIMDIFSEKQVRAFVTTHYDKIYAKCKRLKVKGLNRDAVFNNEKELSQQIDYSLVEETQTDVSHEALHIAEMLGVHNDLLNRANYFLKKNIQN